MAKAERFLRGQYIPPNILTFWEKIQDSKWIDINALNAGGVFSILENRFVKAVQL
jgi:hypothetical protein